MTDALSRLEQLDDDELDALVDIAQARASGAVSRRDLLKTGGALAALGLGGGAAVGSASADASTSDSDGNVGRPSDRYDGFFDGVDAKSVSTGIMTANDYVNLPRADKTISGGTIDVSDASYIQLVEESGSADTLENITGGSDGQIVVLNGPVGGATITVSHSASIALSDATNKTLDGRRDTLTLVYNPGAGAWDQVSYSNS